MVYLLSLPGGWVADKLWGQRKAVFVGGCIIACGHFSMAIPAVPTFYLGLTADRDRHGPAEAQRQRHGRRSVSRRRRAARRRLFDFLHGHQSRARFSDRSLCGLIGERYNFHLGFSLAGIRHGAGPDSVPAGRETSGAGGTFQERRAGARSGRRAARSFYTARRSGGGAGAGVWLPGVLGRAGDFDSGTGRMAWREAS